MAGDDRLDQFHSRIGIGQARAKWCFNANAKATFIGFWHKVFLNIFERVKARKANK